MTIDVSQPRKSLTLPRFGDTTIGGDIKVLGDGSGTDDTTLVKKNHDPSTEAYNFGDSRDVHKPKGLPAARPPMEAIEMDLNSLIAFAQMAFMKSEQGTRHTFMEMAFDEQKDMLDSANKVYDLDIKAAKEDFDAAMATGIGEMAAGAVQVAFSAKAGKDLVSAKSLGSKAGALTKKADELEKNLEQAKVGVDAKISKLETRKEAVSKRNDEAKAELKALEDVRVQKKLDEEDAEETQGPNLKKALKDQIANNEKEVDSLNAQIKNEKDTFTDVEKNVRGMIKTLRSEADLDAKEADWKVKASMAWGQMGNAAGQLTNGAGKVIAAFYTFQANMDRAESKLDSTQQELHNSNYQMYMNFADQAREAMKGAMDSYATTSQGTQSTLNDMARNF
jgi:hypothetical protein